ncbi:MAG: histidine kinase transcriptional regulator protein, partial [Bacteroidia bacterium]|nr:histidine kinase transcriptional regulator protein [Bacteroidia bacterium]
LLEEYLQMEKLRFEHKLAYKIEVDEDIDLDEQLIPSMILQPIVENAVNHGLFHKNENGTIDVRFRQLDSSTFQVSIEDDGIGINRARELYKSSARKYKTRSTAVLQERLELLRQSKNWNITYNIEDRSNSSDATGTVVTLTFNQDRSS